MKKYFPLIAFIAIILFGLGSIPVFAGQETCPNGNGWTKIDSGNLSQYPVSGATQYCFKAGQWVVSSIPEGGFGQDGSCNNGPGFCDLSHWSYYIPDATEEPILGCTDPSAMNYNSSATQDDGSCQYQPTSTPTDAPVYGCTDPNATNYNSSATMNDGSCQYPPTQTDAPTAEPTATATEEERKVDVCHFPPGNPENAHVISISVNALDAHLSENHDDFVMEEGDTCPRVVVTQTPEVTPEITQEPTDEPAHYSIKGRIYICNTDTGLSEATVRVFGGTHDQTYTVGSWGDWSADWLLEGVTYTVQVNPPAGYTLGDVAWQGTITLNQTVSDVNFCYNNGEVTEEPTPTETPYVPPPFPGCPNDGSHDTSDGGEQGYPLPNGGKGYLENATDSVAGSGQGTFTQCACSLISEQSVQTDYVEVDPNDTDAVEYWQNQPEFFEVTNYTDFDFDEPLVFARNTFTNVGCVPDDPDPEIPTCPTADSSKIWSQGWAELWNIFFNGLGMVDVGPGTDTVYNYGNGIFLQCYDPDEPECPVIETVFLVLNNGDTIPEGFDRTPTDYNFNLGVGEGQFLVARTRVLEGQCPEPTPSPTNTPVAPNNPGQPGPEATEPFVPSVIGNVEPTATPQICEEMEWIVLEALDPIGEEPREWEINLYSFDDETQTATFVRVLTENLEGDYRNPKVRDCIWAAEVHLDRDGDGIVEVFVEVRTLGGALISTIENASQPELPQDANTVMVKGNSFDVYTVTGETVSEVQVEGINPDSLGDIIAYTNEDRMISFVSDDGLYSCTTDVRGNRVSLLPSLSGFAYVNSGQISVYEFATETVSVLEDDRFNAAFASDPDDSGRHTVKKLTEADFIANFGDEVSLTYEEAFGFAIDWTDPDSSGPTQEQINAFWAWCDSEYSASADSAETIIWTPQSGDDWGSYLYAQGYTNVWGSEGLVAVCNLNDIPLVADVAVNAPSGCLAQHGSQS